MCWISLSNIHGHNTLLMQRLLHKAGTAVWTMICTALGFYGCEVFNCKNCRFVVQYIRIKSHFDSYCIRLHDYQGRLQDFRRGWGLWVTGTKMRCVFPISVMFGIPQRGGDPQDPPPPLDPPLIIEMIRYFDSGALEGSNCGQFPVWDRGVCLIVLTIATPIL